MREDSQKARLLKLFRENNNMLTLGQIMDTDLGREHSARFSELKKMGYDITCTINKKKPSQNLYVLYEPQKQSSKTERPSPYKDNTGYMVELPCPKCGSFWRRSGECNVCRA